MHSQQWSDIEQIVKKGSACVIGACLDRSLVQIDEQPAGGPAGGRKERESIWPSLMQIDPASAERDDGMDGS
jgi:hypothetical protein